MFVFVFVFHFYVSANFAYIRTEREGDGEKWRVRKVERMRGTSENKKNDHENQLILVIAGGQRTRTRSIVQYSF